MLPCSAGSYSPIRFRKAAADIVTFVNNALSFGKLLAGYSGDVQMAIGWLNFFFYAAATGIPAVVLSIFVARRIKAMATDD